MTDNPKQDLEETPVEEGRCVRCRNWLSLCGHDLDFSERIKHIAIDRTSLQVR